MADDVNTILEGAKKTLAESQQKFPSQSPAPQPSYSQARQERKVPTMKEEVAAKADSLAKARKALE